MRIRGWLGCVSAHLGWVHGHGCGYAQGVAAVCAQVLQQSKSSWFLNGNPPGACWKLQHRQPHTIYHPVRQLLPGQGPQWVFNECP